MLNYVCSKKKSVHNFEINQHVFITESSGATKEALKDYLIDVVNTIKYLSVFT